MNPKPTPSQILDLQEAALKKHHFRSNYIVRLTDRQPPAIHGIPVKLTPHALVLLLILARRALETPGEFVPTETLLAEITRGHQLLGQLRLSWAAPNEHQIYSAASRIRQALCRNRLRDDLLESVRGGLGYRLSTPASNVEIAFSGAETLGKLLLPPASAPRAKGRLTLPLVSHP